MTCGAEIKPYDLIPIFSWLFLRGRCRNCGEHISFRYTVVESLTALCFLAVFIMWDATLDGFIYPVLLCLFIATVIVVGFEDFDTQEMTLGVLIVSGVIALVTVGYTNFFAGETILTLTGTNLTDSLIGLFAVSLPLLLIGFVITPLFYAVFIQEDRKILRNLRRRLNGGNLSTKETEKLAELISAAQARIKETGFVFGLGLGDVVLMATAGLMLGFKAVIIAFAVGAILAAVYAVILMIRRRRTDAEQTKSFALGPFLCIGIISAVFFGNTLFDLYTKVW
jgi:leader peptidase (prepilin peptidase)/N-methyltransferase